MANGQGSAIQLLQHWRNPDSNQNSDLLQATIELALLAQILCATSINRSGPESFCCCDIQHYSSESWNAIRWLVTNCQANQPVFYLITCRTKGSVICNLRCTIAGDCRGIGLLPHDKHVTEELCAFATAAVLECARHSQHLTKAEQASQEVSRAHESCTFGWVHRSVLLLASSLDIHNFIGASWALRPVAKEPDHQRNCQGDLCALGLKCFAGVLSGRRSSLTIASRAHCLWEQHVDRVFGHPSVEPACLAWGLADRSCSNFSCSAVLVHCSLRELWWVFLLQIMPQRFEPRKPCVCIENNAICITGTHCTSKKASIEVHHWALYGQNSLLAIMIPVRVPRASACRMGVLEIPHALHGPEYVMPNVERLILVDFWTGTIFILERHHHLISFGSCAGHIFSEHGPNMHILACNYLGYCGRPWWTIDQPGPVQQASANRVAECDLTTTLGWKAHIIPMAITC